MPTKLTSFLSFLSKGKTRSKSREPSNRRASSTDRTKGVKSCWIEKGKGYQPVTNSISIVSIVDHFMAAKDKSVALAKSTVPANESVLDTPPFPFLELAAELREQIYEYLVISSRPLRKVNEYDDQSSTKFAKALNLRLVNRQISEEVAAIFFKHNTFIINHVDNLPSSLTGQQSLRRIEMVYPIVIDDTNSLTQYLANSRNIRYISIKSHGTVLDINATHSAWLAASLQVLSYEDGGLEFISGWIYDSFRIYGKRSGIRKEVAKKFIEGCQVECSRITRLGVCSFPMEEFVIEGVKVGIGHTLGGITTARIL